MRGIDRVLGGAAVAAIVLGGIGGGVAHADDLKDTIVGSHSVSLIAGSGSGTAAISVEARGGDGDAGCNIDGGESPLRLDVVTPPGITATPDPLSFTTCGQLDVTFTAAASAQSGVATVAILDPRPAGGGSYDNQVAIPITITRPDTTAPTLHLPDDLTVPATSAGGAEVTYTATAEDTAPARPATTCVPPSGSTFPVGTTTVTCSATDTAGNRAEGDFTVTVQPFTAPDTTAPTVQAPADITVDASNAQGAAVTYDGATGQDDRDGPVPASCLPASGSIFPIGTTNVTCTATDAAGNTGTAGFTVTVIDGGPLLELPEAVVAEAISAAGADVSYAASASDTVDGPLDARCAPGPGAAFPLGATTVHCSATDSAGNTTTGEFLVTVHDSTAPVVTVPPTTGLEAAGSTGTRHTFTATAHDAVDGDLVAVCDPASPAEFPLGDTTVTCTATDAAGNIGEASFTVTVADTTAPSLVLPEGATAEATGPSGAPVDFDASATDLVDGAVDVTCDPGSGSTFALGTTPVTCTATDAAGNAANGEFTVTVTDTTAPTLTLPADIADVEATGPGGATVVFDASATDLVDGDVDVACTPASGSTLALGTGTVTCTATDAHGNTATDTFTVGVVDTTKPQLTVPADITEEATGPDGTTVRFATSAVDTVDTFAAVTCDAPAGSFPLGTTVVTCTATDDSGNTDTRSFSVTVRDTTSPANLQFVGGPADGASYLRGQVPALGTCTATDAVTVAPTCTVTQAATGSTYPQRITVTATATDAAGNTTTRTLSYTVRALSLGGFFAPVDMAGVVNTVKNGSTVPLKFTVADGGVAQTSVGIVRGFSAKKVNCLTGAATDDIEVTTTGGTALRYDAIAGQFIQNWKTPTGAGTCYEVTLTTVDDSTLKASFRLR